MILRCAFAFSLCCAALFGAQPALEFSGVLTDGEKTRVALTDTATGQTTWVDLGADHNGYAVESYDPKSETVTLKRGLDEIPLRLVVAKSPAPAEPAIAAGAGPATAAAAPADADAITAGVQDNLRRLADAARRHRSATGAATATYADLVGPDKYIPELAPVDGESYAGLVFGPGAANLSVTTASGVTVAIDTVPAAGPGANVAAAGASPPAEPATPAPAPTGPVNATHVARAGETLASIATATGVPVEQLQAMNPDVNPGSLKAGQPIRIR